MGKFKNYDKVKVRSKLILEAVTEMKINEHNEVCIEYEVEVSDCYLMR